MKRIHIAYCLLAACFLLAACSANRKAIVLFDAASTPLDSIERQGGSVLSQEKDWLVIDTKAEPSAPGIRIDGHWDLSGCNKLVIELQNLNTLGSLPVTVSLENAKASQTNRQGLFLDRLYIPAGQTKKFELTLPVPAPHPEVAEQFAGMRMTPYDRWGLISDVDLSKLVRLAIYVNKPRTDWKWAVKQVSALRGAPDTLPVYMQMTAKEFFPFIDRYGQFKYKTWPGKTETDGDLKAAYEQELKDLEAHPGPEDRTTYGGWKNGPKYEGTGSFRVEKINGKWWMIDPEGYLYWSHGVVRVTPSSGITPLDKRDNYFTGLPAPGTDEAQFYETQDTLLYPYYTARGIQRTFDFSAANIRRKYGNDWRAIYADMAHKRLKSWGLNTIANSSDRSICFQDRTPYTDRIEIKSPVIEGSVGMWWKFRDPFHPEFRLNLRKQLQEHQRALQDPWCLGYFVDNEIDWGGDTSLAVWTLQSPATQPAKREMISRLQKKYGGIDQLNTAWQSNYASWDALLAAQQKPPHGAASDCAEFSAAITEAYFSIIREEFKKAAPNKLYLGCRFARSNEHALRIGAKYCDVISYNIYSHNLDDFRLPEGIDKPVMIGEFHFGALDRGLFHPTLIKTDNQEERGEAYAEYVRSALRHPNMIGTHWHQFADQATTGRFDGENFQVGMVDICDHPYPETIRMIREVGYQLYQLRDSSLLKKN